MSDKDKEESHSSWHDGHVSIMVATRAFGLGINKKNIHLAIQHGLPSDLSSWVQEFGRAGQDGLPATACIVYSDDDIQHLCYWLCNGDKQRNSSIAIDFSKRLNFLMHILQENVIMKLSWKGSVNKCKCNKMLIIVSMYVLSHRYH